MIKVTKFGETTYLKDWHERIDDFKKRFPTSSNTKRILSMSDEELDSHYKKLREEDESKFLGSDERLAYYRSHGLTNCSDYPGGDAAFVRDVLSGDQREEHRPFMFDMKQEDSYICRCIECGRFKIDLDFRMHFRMHPKVILTVESAYVWMCGYSPGKNPNYEKEIMSPDSDWYNDKPSVGGYYCPLPIFPSAEEE